MKAFYVILLLSCVAISLAAVNRCDGKCDFNPCVDQERERGHCCPHCPHGPNCYAGHQVIKGSGDIVTVVDGKNCRCAKKGEAGYEDNESICEDV
ncbi:hypothetical protein SNE40_023012 [Patella caerulea]|uniref:Uncharacterized protein n=1 Tax=Patella caerulea TaxID=87958 RepID=A0AAN8IWH1_PATCE